jgi:hypothetical protein
MKGITGEPRALLWAKSSPAFDAGKNKAYTFDLDEAKSLLALSGMSNIEFDISWALVQWRAAECGCIHAAVRSRLRICAHSHVWLCQQRCWVLR